MSCLIAQRGLPGLLLRIQDGLCIHLGISGRKCWQPHVEGMRSQVIKRGLPVLMMGIRTPESDRQSFTASWRAAVCRASTRTSTSGTS